MSDTKQPIPNDEPDLVAVFPSDDDPNWREKAYLHRPLDENEAKETPR